MTKHSKQLLLWGCGLPLGIGVVMAVVLPGVIRHSLSHGRMTGERHAVNSLKAIATAQAEFQANDRDGNGRNDYWRGDIAGLWAMRVDGRKLMLIDPVTAAADDRPLPVHAREITKGSRSGYRFRALRFADEKEPDPRRFAVLAYPEDLETGRSLFIITQDYTVYQKRVEQIEPFDVVPSPDALKEWSPLD